MDAQGIPIADVTSIGQANNGDFIQVAFRFADGNVANFFIPHKLAPKILLALQSGAGMAAEERIKTFGSTASADAFLGVAPLHIESFDVGSAINNSTGKTAVILQARTPEKFSIDLGMAPSQANDIADSLKKASLAAQSMTPKKPN